MHFKVSIQTADGGRRTEEFESAYDANAVLEQHVREHILQDGEEIVTIPAMTLPDARKYDRDMKASVPAIERVNR